MKKYFFSITAILLAIGFSSFTNRHATHKTTGTIYWWYIVDGTKTSGPKINSVQVDKAGAIASLTQCDDSVDPFCLYGSTNSNLVDFDFGGNPPADQLILHD